MKYRFIFAGMFVGGALGAQATTQTPAPIKRRAIDIRGQAPAPEVVTVRPREIPSYTRRIIAPTVLAPPAPQRPSDTVVIFPVAPEPSPSVPPTQKPR